MSQPIPVNSFYPNGYGAPAKGPDADVKMWREFFRTNAQARRVNLVRARVAQYQYQGIMSAYGADMDQYISFDTTNRLGIMRYPLIPNAIDMASSMMMGQQIMLSPVASGTSSGDMVRQRAAALILHEFAMRNATRENNIELGKHLLITGRAFKQLYTNEEYVPVVMPPDVIEVYAKMREDTMARKGFPNYRFKVMANSISQMPDGQVRFSTNLPVIKEALVPCFNMLVETGCDDLGNCTQFAHFEVMSIRRVAQLYNDVGFDFAKLRPMVVTDKLIGDPSGQVNGSRYGQSASDQSAESFGTEANQVCVYNCWQLLEPNKWLNTIIVQDGSGLNYHKIHQEEKGYHPYISYGCRHSPGYFWDDGVAYDAVDPARAYCMNMTDLQKNFQSAMKDIVVMDNSMKGEPVSTGFNQVIYAPARSLNSIRRLEMPAGAHQQLLSLANSHKASVFEAIGLSEAARGIIKPHTTDSAVNTARNSNVNLGTTYNKIVSSEAFQKGPKILRMASELYDEPRYLAATGNTDSASIISRAVRGRDLGGDYSVEVSDGIQLPSTYEERMELAMNLSKNGLFESIAELKDFVKFQKGLLPINSTEALERNRALLENDWIVEGAAVPEGVDAQGMPGPVVYIGPDENTYGTPLLRQTDIDQIHLDEHTKRFREGGIPREAMAAFQAHLAEHQNRVAQSEEAAFNRQMEMLAVESQASQAGQMVLQRMADRNNAVQGIVKALQTPADGGRKSGSVRRGERQFPQ